MIRLSNFAACLWALLACCGLAFAQGESVKIGVIAELSGPYAENGDNCRRGVESAFADFTDSGKIGRVAIQLSYGDSKGEAASGVVEFKRLTEIERISALIATRSQVSMPINPLSKRLRLPFLGNVGHPNFTAQNPFAFRVFPNTRSEAEILTRGALHTNAKRIALITLEDDWTLALSHDFKEALDKAGLKVVADETILPSEAEFGSLITRVLKASPDAVFLNVGMASLPQLLKRLREQDKSIKVLSNFWIGKSDIVSASSGSAEGVIFDEPNLDIGGLKESVRRKFGEERASATTLGCYSAMALICQAVRQGYGGSLFEGLNMARSLNLSGSAIPLRNRELQFPLTLKVIRGSAVDSYSW